MVKVLDFIKKPALIASIATALILSIALLFMSIGMADNGDYFRVLTSNDLYSYQQDDEDAYFGYFNNEYGIRQYFNDSTAGGITTSQSIFIQAAVAIDTFFTHDSVFDVRFLAGIEILMLAFGVYLFVDYLTFKKKPLAGYLIAALAVFIFADLAYGAYFNSFFQEGIVFVSFMICISSALLLGQKRGYNLYFLMAMFGFGALILIFAKQQNAPLGIVMAILCIFIAMRTHLKPLRGIALFLAATLAVSGIAVYMLIPNKFVDINKYQTMTRGTTLSAENPEDALAQFLINRQYALLNGTTTFDRYPVIKYDDPTMTEDFYDKFSYMDVAIFYLKNPNQLYIMMDYASKNLYLTRPEMLGNYEKSAGKEEGAQTNFFVAYSTFKQNVTPKTIGFLIIWCLAAILLGMRNRYQMLIIILSVLMGLSQILVSIVGDGDADFAKHVFLFTLVFDYVNAIGFAWLIQFVFGKQKKKIEIIPLPEEEEGYYVELPEEKRERYGEPHVGRRTRHPGILVGGRRAKNRGVPAENGEASGELSEEKKVENGEQPTAEIGTRNRQISKGRRAKNGKASAENREGQEEPSAEIGSRNSKRQKRKGRKTTFCLCLLLFGTMAATGCTAAPESLTDKNNAAASEKNGTVQGASAQQQMGKEEKTFAFIQQKMSVDGGIRTNYLNEEYTADYATGAEVLSESEGLYMLYAVLINDEEVFAQTLAFTQKNLDNSALFMYRFDPSGKHVYNMNAALDDMRIIRAITEAGETFKNDQYTALAKKMAERFYNTNVKDEYLYGLYDSDYHKTNDTIPLCYIDLDTMNSLSGFDGKFAQSAVKMQEILKNGFISNAFPLYHTEYSYADSLYHSDQGISMVQSMLCALHLAEVGACPAQTVAYIKNKVSTGELFGQYDISGEPQNNVQSTALYAIAALIGRAVSDDALYSESITQMDKFRVIDESSEVFGAYADGGTKSAYSFDNLMALLSLRAGD